MTPDPQKPDPKIERRRRRQRHLTRATRTQAGTYVFGDWPSKPPLSWRRLKRIARKAYA